MTIPPRVSNALTRRTLFAGAVGTTAVAATHRHMQSQQMPVALASGAATDLHEAIDFRYQTTAFPFVTGSLAGSGRNVTVYRMRSDTSTAKRIVDALVPYQTNQYHLMRFWPRDHSDGPDIGGFTVQATSQSHPYNGAQVGYSVGAHVHDVKITGLPGFDSSPPGETFSLSLWHADHAVIERVVCDGRVSPTTESVGVAATLFGQNYVTSPTFHHCTARYAHAGFGSASFECVGETWQDSLFAHNRRHLNIERTFGGTFHYLRCTFRAATVPYVAQVSTDPAHGSARVIFEDCRVDGDGVLRARVYGPSAVNSQRDSDIRCIKGGVDVTDDASHFQLVRSG